MSRYRYEKRPPGFVSIETLAREGAGGLARRRARARGLRRSCCDYLTLTWRVPLNAPPLVLFVPSKETVHAPF